MHVSDIFTHPLSRRMSKLYLDILSFAPFFVLNFSCMYLFLVLVVFSLLHGDSIYFSHHLLSISNVHVPSDRSMLVVSKLLRSIIDSIT